jgi:hypothetical protein
MARHRQTYPDGETVAGMSMPSACRPPALLHQRTCGFSRLVNARYWPVSAPYFPTNSLRRTSFGLNPHHQALSSNYRNDFQPPSARRRKTVHFTKPVPRGLNRHSPFFHSTSRPLSRAHKHASAKPLNLHTGSGIHAPMNRGWESHKAWRHHHSPTRCRHIPAHADSHSQAGYPASPCPTTPWARQWWFPR